MKKAPNNNSDVPDRDFSLPRAKILRGRDNFQRLFNRDAVVFRTRYVNLRFRLFRDSTNSYLMGFIVKKNLGKAVQRNRIKRLMREAYRLNQHLLSDYITSSPFSFHGVLMANQIDFTYTDAERCITELLTLAKDHILSITDSDS